MPACMTLPTLDLPVFLCSSVQYQHLCTQGNCPCSSAEPRLPHVILLQRTGSQTLLFRIAWSQPRLQQPLQVAYLLLYGNLPSAKELARFEEAVARHSAVPASVEEAIKALPHDAHFMGSILVGINALSTCHPEQNPALAGQDVYKSKEIQDKQIVRLIGMLTQTRLPTYCCSRLPCLK